MKRFIALLDIVLALSLLLAGCGPTPTPTPTPTPPPPTPDVSDWPLVMEDGFDESESGFAERSYAHGRWFYQDGRYGIEVTKENWVMWTSQGNFSDFMLEVDVIPQKSAGWAGVVFRLVGEGDQFYSFCISTDGQYSLDKLTGIQYEQSHWETILPWQESLHIRDGLATNRLRVICVGSRIWLYVNDRYLNTVQDTSFGAGEIGMIAENFSSDSYALFNFDNLRVYAPR